MNYIVSAVTDVGIKKSTNQDSVALKVINTSQGRIVFALLCDGMGGLAKGEVASAAVIKEFDRWCREELPELSKNAIDDNTLKAQWENIITKMNDKIKSYGRGFGIQLGTTVVAMLITDSRYYIMNVGDSRAYELSDNIYQLTQDQTFIEREVSLGHMTREQAENDPRKSVLLQCVGASDIVYPDMFFGETKKDAVYMLCSDGFRHVISSEEIYNGIGPNSVYSETDMSNNATKLIEIVKQRMENDNISVAMIRTF